MPPIFFIDTVLQIKVVYNLDGVSSNILPNIPSAFGRWKKKTA